MIHPWYDWQERPKRLPRHRFQWWWTFHRYRLVRPWGVLVFLLVAFVWRFHQSPGDDYSTVVVVLWPFGNDGIVVSNTTTTDPLIRPLSLSTTTLVGVNPIFPPVSSLPVVRTNSSNNNGNNNNNNNNRKDNNNHTQFSLGETKLRLVMVGDSLSRYMYLSLVYYIQHDGQSWVPPGHEILEKVKDSKPEAWNDWLAFTNRELVYEECDCYRYWKHPFKWNKHCENRYFYWQDHAIAFITKFGGNPFHGHVPASHIFTNLSWGINQTERSYDWFYPTWDGLIEHYIAQWNPKPNLFLFNQGHWKAHELRDVKVLKSLRRSLKKHGIRGIYRTTTFRQDERVVVGVVGDDGNNVSVRGGGMGGVEAASYAAFRHADTRKHDSLVCQYFECLNVSWTAGIPTTEYVDPVHFKASISNRMNEQFLQEFVIGSR